MPRINPVSTLFVLTVCACATAFARQSSYSIRHTDLTIRPDISKKTLSVSAVFEIQNPAHEHEFSFGLNDKYDTVLVTESLTTTSIQRGDGEVTVKLKNPPEHVRLEFTLYGALGKSNDERCDIVSDTSLFLLWSDRFYPIDFDRWSPLKTTLILPAGFQAIAPGTITARKSSGPDVVITFESSKPVVSASVFADRRWVTTERMVNGIRMRTMLFPESQQWSDQIFRTSGEIVKYFSDLLSPYPFDEYSFVTIGGMYARRAFPGFVGYEPRYLQKEFTTTGHDAHETSLLWWTYTLHGTGPGSFQWTEGFGDYVELMYDEDAHKPIPTIFNRFRSEYLATPAEQDLLYSALRGNTPQKLVHGKYPWLMHLVRGVVGDSAFRGALRLVFRRFDHRTFTMNEFVSAMEEGSGQSLQWWREDWLERKGVLSVAFGSRIEKRSSGFLVTCTIEQQGDVYRVPVEIGIESGGRVNTERVFLNQKRTICTFEANQEPTRVLLDPHGWLPMRVMPLE
jgi:hypothetical protein